MNRDWSKRSFDLAATAALIAYGVYAYVQIFPSDETRSTDQGIVSAAISSQHTGVSVDDLLVQAEAAPTEDMAIVTLMAGDQADAEVFRDPSGNARAHTAVAMQTIDEAASSQALFEEIRSLTARAIDALEDQTEVPLIDVDISLTEGTPLRPRARAPITQSDHDPGITEEVTREPRQNVVATAPKIALRPVARPPNVSRRAARRIDTDQSVVTRNVLAPPIKTAPQTAPIVRMDRERDRPGSTSASGRIVGVFETPEGKWALFQEDVGSIRILRVGDRVGRGTVASIANGAVQVTTGNGNRALTTGDGL